MRCYGYEKDGRTIIAGEAAVVRDVVDRLLAGATVGAIVADLRVRAMPTSGRGLWTGQTLTRLLRNPRLAGRRTDGGEAEPIIDPAVHRELVTILDAPARRQPDATNIRRHLLSGLLICGRPGPTGACGKPLYLQPAATSRGYVCRSGGPSYGCGGLRIAAGPVDAEVTRRALERLRTPRVVARLAALAAAANPEAVAALEERLAETTRLESDRLLRPATAATIMQEIASQRRFLLDADAQGERLRRLAGIGPAGLDGWWRNAPVDDRHEMLALVLDRVLVHPAERPGRRGPDARRLEYVWR